MGAVALLTVAIRREQDVLIARQRTRKISQFLGFSVGDTTRITTSLSEVARNAFEYAGGGTVAFAVETQALDGGQELIIRVVDQGPGIKDVNAVLAPDFQSRTGMGLGIKGSRALMDRFTITSNSGGTTVVMAKRLPWSAARFGSAEAARLSAELAQASVATPLGELQSQNQALLNALQELTIHQAEVERLGKVADAARARAEEAQIVAERSLVVRDRFMALTTHELRTPLNSILGYLELLNMELSASLNDKQQNYFTRVQRACKHMLGLVNDFLDMAQGDAGSLTVTRHEDAARHVMSEASALLAPQALARNVSLNLRETTGRLMYLGDPDRVRQVLVNVIGNAVSFTPPGGTVEVIAERFTGTPPGTALAPGSWCGIRVEDTGPGIPADKIAHVFEPFVQLSSSGQSERKGSGLGLTVSRQLALLMGGELTASSADAGAIFTLWLPEGQVRDEKAEPAQAVASSA